ncbi:MAG: hypothetical protein KIY11_03455 [Thermoplasmata archaeon]|nr:hypothetical protein [Candidatus Sysuiplasma acidicola]
MSEDKEFPLDEKEYKSILNAGGRKALIAARHAFARFGFRSNFMMVTDSLFSLEYPQGDSFSPVRTIHHSKHINSHLTGINTQLPILHAVMMSSGRSVSTTAGRAGSSLTSTQLVFEMLRAIDDGGRNRACSLAMELASRGKYELLVDTLREETVRRYSYSFTPSILLNAIRCIVSGNGFTEGAARVAASAVTGAGISPDAVNATKALKYAGVSTDRAAENDHFPDGDIDQRVAASIRSGIPEMALRVIADELNKGVSPRCILNTICLEALLNSAGSEKKSTYEFIVQNSSSIIESIVSSGVVKSADIIEMMTIASHLSQIYTARDTASPVTENSRQWSVDEAVSMFENGDPSALIGILYSKGGDSEFTRISTYVAELVVTCDQTGLYSESLCHCSSSMLCGSLLDSSASRAASLRECVSYLSALRKRGAECNNTVSSTVHDEVESST